MVNIAQLEQDINKLYGYVEDGEEHDGLSDNAWDEFRWDLDNKNPITLDSGDALLVDSLGGEGDGAPMSIIFSVNGTLLRREGCYSSWDSDYWDGDIHEVEPFEVTVTQYREKK